MSALIICLIALAAYFGCDWYWHQPAGVAKAYVGSATCAECHAREANLFRQSHHDLAMAPADETSVLGNFENQELEHRGIRSRMFRRDGKFMVATEGPSGSVEEFQITHVFGTHPLQQYLAALGPESGGPGPPIGRRQVLRLSWDVDQGRWFYLDPPDVKEALAPSDPLHWTGITQCWNTHCASCHSTALHKNFDRQTRTYQTVWSEIDVGCEACHGPGSLHVGLARAASPFWDRLHGFGLARLKDSDHRIQVDACAPCHSLRQELTEDWTPGSGREFSGAFRQEWIQPGHFFVDGQQREEVYTHHSFLQSRMYAAGIRCSDCHDPHSTRVKFTDNRLCTSCHQHPAAKYDSPEHHHHPAGSNGAACVACHMPAVTYMAIDPRRDHSLRVPRPDLSLQYGTPNACTGCHIDPTKVDANARESLRHYSEWIEARTRNQSVQDELTAVDAAMAAAVERWYGWSKQPPASDWYPQMARFLSQPQGLLKDREILVRDTGLPAIVRASVLAQFPSLSDSASRDLIESQLAARDPLLVAAALDCLHQHWSRLDPEGIVAENGYGALVKAAAEALRRDELALRIAAFELFCTWPRSFREQLFNSDQLAAWEGVKEEWFRYLELHGDRAFSSIAKSRYAIANDDLNGAIAACRDAIAIEPNAPGARSELAELLETQAASILNRQSGAGTELNSQNNAAANSQFATLMADVQRLRNEEHQILALELDRAKDLPGVHEIHYRYAMSSYFQRQLDQTERHLKAALALQPAEPRYLLALATLLGEQNRADEARPLVRQLLQEDPDRPDYLGLLNWLNQNPGQPLPVPKTQPDMKDHDPN